MILFQEAMIRIVADILGHLDVPGTVLSPFHATEHLTQQVFELGTTLSCFTDEQLSFKLKAKTQMRLLHS